jgi:predicted deacylase
VRESPIDGCNLARVFPGRADGTVTERLAHALVENVIAGADLLIDLHSAGRQFEMPFFAGWSAEPVALAERAEAAARAFGTPLLWRHDGVSQGRSLSSARDLRVPAIYVEAAGGGTIRGEQLDGMVAGVRRVLAVLGMTAATERRHDPAQLLDGGDGDTDAGLMCVTGGYCVLRAGAGSVVEVGQVIAEILDANANVIEVVRAPRAATITYVCRRTRVTAGASIAMLGAVPRPAD